MIYLITLFSSLLIQIGAFNIQPYNDINYTIVDAVRQKLQSGNNWQQTYSLVDSSNYFVLDMANGTYKLFIPRELPEPNYPSSISVNDSNGHYISCTMYNYVEMTYNPSNNVVGFQWPSSTSYTFYYPTESLTPTIVFCGADNFYYNGDYLIKLINTPVLDVGAHSSGWSDLIQEVEGNNYTVLGHSTGKLDNSNTIDLVDSSSNLTDKLLTVLINLTSGMNDNISFGLGTLISLFQQGLDVVGLDSIATKLDNIFNKVESGVNTTEDYISWVSEPFDSAEFDIAVQNSGFGNFSALAHTLQTTIETSRVDNTHVYITLDLSDIQYFSGFGSETYDLALYLNGTKNVWQPLLLTFIYATIFWGFFRSLPNIIGGASPVASSISGGVKNAK